MSTTAQDTQWETHPVTPDRFEDFAAIVNPTGRDKHCWCLSPPAGQGDR